MTEFEKALYERLNSARKEGEEDIKKKIVKGLELEFLDLVPRYIAPGTEIKPLVAETIWINFAGYKETQRQYKLAFAQKEKFFTGIEEVEAFAKEIMNMFPSENIDCHILNAVSWSKSESMGSRAFGLEFSLKVDIEEKDV